MRNPATTKIIANITGEFIITAVNAIGKKIAYIFVLSKKYVWTFVPDKTISTMTVSMATGIVRLLKNYTMLMAYMVGRAETRKPCFKNSFLPYKE